MLRCLISLDAIPESSLGPKVSCRLEAELPQEPSKALRAQATGQSSWTSAPEAHSFCSPAFMWQF